MTSDQTPTKPPKDQYRWSAAGFIAPGVLLVAVLLYLPLLWTTAISLTEYNGLGDPEWVGLANYAEMLDDPEFLGSVLNTLLWVARHPPRPRRHRPRHRPAHLEPPRRHLAAAPVPASRTRSRGSASA